MLNKMLYGKEKQTTYLDNNGSTKTVERNYVHGNVKKPIRKRYEIRERVGSKREELAEIIKFYESLKPEHLDPEIKLKVWSRTAEEQGKWDVVLCYTVLED
jgi:hypothetical protein